MEELIGQQIEQYILEAVIGKGSLGTVYRARDLNLERPVAFKVIDPVLAKQPGFETHVLQAARTASRLTHPAIVPVYNFGHQNGRLYIVTAFVAGTSLSRVAASLADDRRTVRLDESLHLVAQIADALGSAHQEGVWHENMKPGNILIKRLDRPSRTGEPPLKAMLADFGLAPIPETGIQTAANIPVNLLPYLSPEQCAGSKHDARSDIYGLGIILYQLLAGQLPFNITSPTEAVRRHSVENPLPLREIRPGIPIHITRIVDIAMAKKPAERFQLAEHMADALRQAADMLTAADTLLFAPQETITSLVEHTGYLETAAKLEETVSEEPSPSDGVQPFTSTPEPTPDNDKGVTNWLTKNKRLPPVGLALLGIHPPDTGELESMPIEERDTPVYPQQQQQDTPVSTPLTDTGVHTSPPPIIGDEMIITRQGRSPRRFSLNKPKIKIGRSRDNDLVLETLDVSRYHARLEQTDDGWQIIDLNSRGGTFWNGSKLKPHVTEALRPHETLQIGPYLLYWQALEKVEDPKVDTVMEEQVTQLFQLPEGASQSQSHQGNFSVAVNPTSLSLSAGDQAAVQIELFNQGTAVNEFIVHIDGLPARSVIMPQNSVSLAPGARASLSLTIRLPANLSTNKEMTTAGEYPYQIVVQANNNEDKAVLTGQLTITPSEAFSIGIWPTQVIHGGTCRILIRNEGNAPATYTVVGRDPTGLLQFRGEQGRLRLEPGEAVTRVVTITHKERPLFGRRKQFPFEIEVRSGSGMSQTKSGILEQIPRIPGWTLPLVEIILVLIFALMVMTNIAENKHTPVANTAATPTAVVAITGDTMTMTAGAGSNTSDPPGAVPEVEVAATVAGPLSADTDGDGLLDGAEINIYGTNPTHPDTDLDGILDGAEIENGTDPLRLPVVTATPPTASTAATTIPPPATLPATDTAVPTPEPTSPPSPTSIPPTDNPQSNSEVITVELSFLPDESGWIDESGQIGNTPFQAGDQNNSEAVRGLLSFDVSPLPANASIQSARILLSDTETQGTPFTALGCLLFEAVEFDPPLNGFVFDLDAFYISCESGPPVALDVAIDVQDTINFNLDRLQIRFSFESLTNHDSVADLYVIRTAPTLQVTYLTP